MFAIIAVIIFGLLFILALTDEDLGEIGDVLTNEALLYAGLLCLALHFAGVGVGATTGRKWWARR
jgi:hypothetical protein